VSEKRLAPRAADLQVEGPWLLWTPWLVDADGVAEAAYAL
jgi:hypothetical protein